MIRVRTLTHDPVGTSAELSVDLTTRTDHQALRAMIGSLGRSRQAAHQKTADELQYRVNSGAALVRVELDPSAVLRIRGTLRFVYSKNGAFPNHGWRELARAIECAYTHIVTSPVVAHAHR